MEPDESPSAWCNTQPDAWDLVSDATYKKARSPMKEFTLLDMFESHGGRQIDKWRHYFDVYERHLAKYRGQSPRVLELGVDHGGSLQLWKRYFGAKAEIIGIDTNPLSGFEEPQIKVYLFDQTNPDIAKLGPFDIVIDDGSHL